MTSKKKEPKRPVHYTDAYYAKDGYRTRQYRAKLSMDRRYARPISLIDGGEYLFNEFPNRKKRRQMAQSKGIFKLGIWGDTVKRLNNRQTFVKLKEEVTA